MKVHERVRKDVATLVDDRAPAPDLARLTEIIRSGALEYASGSVVN
jgi:histidine ammonia-lyase